ncbi:DUF2752 domain-containing protein [Synechococcus sp. A10-1-5-1]|nr:DUF2752 domain-containing protein [Synechococcus sp. A10-1-5-1]UPM51523.1 DUF2752 domain-containing protein [Synechococcus sp. A10-1-5-1]
MQSSGYLLPAGLTGSLWLKGLHPGLPGWSCPLRALTGIPCPTCYLTRATAASLTGNLDGALELHAFGPVMAGLLIGWSVLSIRQRRLLPRGIPAWPLGAMALALLGYWLLRLGVSLGGWLGPGLLHFPLAQLS